MRHNRDRKSLNRTASHRKAMLSNMVTSLFRRERIRTSKRKAKEARRVAERMITYAKKGDLASRRQAARIVRDKKVLQKLFDKIGPRFAERNGGYTRIFKMVRREGDNTDMAMLELLPADAKKRGKKQSRKTYRKIDIPEDPIIAAEKKKKEEAESKKKEAEQKAEEKKKEEEEKAEKKKKEAGQEEKAEAEEEEADQPEEENTEEQEDSGEEEEKKKE